MTFHIDRAAHADVALEEDGGLRAGRPGDDLTRGGNEPVAPGVERELELGHVGQRGHDARMRAGGVLGEPHEGVGVDDDARGLRHCAAGYTSV